MYNVANDFEKLINANPGYSQIPNFIFVLGLSKHALLVFFYLIRCANRQKGNTCFPSIRNICKKCSIPSETTVRAAIHDLHDRGLITKETLGRKNIYKISNYIYLAIDLANGKECYISELEDISPYSDGIENEEIEIVTMDTHSDGTPPLDDEIEQDSDDEYHQHVLPNKTNRIRLTNNTNKQEEKNSVNTNFERVNIDSKVSTTGKTIPLAEANEYYQSLIDEEKKKFDSASRLLVRTGEPDLRNSLVSQRTVRCRFHELLLGLDKWKQSMPKLVGDEPFYLPMETLKSKHEYVDALSHTVENKEAAL